MKDTGLVKKEWQAVSAEVAEGMLAWRKQHPSATLREIEQELDRQLAQLRAKMLEDAALLSEKREWVDGIDGTPSCPACGVALKGRSRAERQLQTHGEKTIRIERQYGICPKCGQGFFPLDEELKLLSSRVTPHAHECAVRLGTQIPFEKAAREIGWILGVLLSEPSVRRHTEEAGAAYVAWQAAEVERLERETPPAPAGPEKLLMSTDGAMVPLVGGEWAEVKTVVLGEIGEPVLEQGEWVVHSRKHSYFSRLMEAKAFRRQALVETHRRGVETAREVAAVMDGAEWGQGFTDYHRMDAMRVLDFAHAAEYVCEIGQIVWGEGTSISQQWMGQQLHLLKHAGPEAVLAEIRHLGEQNPGAPKLFENLAYLEKREHLMQYPDYQRRGFPIGSGTVESGNKVVVEARLKGAGMHWARPHVNPILGLRNAFCSERWEEAWAQILTQLHQQACEHRRKRHHEKQVARSAPLPRQENQAPAGIEPNHPAPTAPEVVQVPAETPAMPKRPWRPPANHPWRRTPLSRPKLPPADYPSKN